MDCSPTGSSVHRISQVRILEWVAISCSRGFSRPSIKRMPPSLGGRFFTTETPSKLSHHDMWNQTYCCWVTQFSSVQFSHSAVSNSLQHHGLQDAMPPCPSPSPGVYSVQLSYPYMTARNTITLITWTFLAKWYLCFLVAKSCPTLLWPYGL